MGPPKMLENRQTDWQFLQLTELRPGPKDEPMAQDSW